MMQMRDKLETCSLNSSSSKESSDYFEAYTSRPAKSKEEDISDGQYTAEMIIEIKNRVGQLVIVFNDHLDKVKEVLTVSCLERVGFRSNIRKRFFAEGKLEYLGYSISRNGIQPQPKKVEVILGLKQPQNKRQFLRHLYYYREMLW
jgi:hypothetical protein